MTVQQKLAEAEKAYHALLTGTQAVTIEKDGRKVEFNRINISRLRAYIAELKADLNPSLSMRRRPAGARL